MSWAAIAVGATTATVAGVKAYQGHRQKKKGEAMEDALGDQPKYEVPEEVLASLSLAQRQALEGMPAEQQQQYVENMQSMQATGFNQMADRKGGLVGVGEMSQTVTEGYRNMLSMDAQQRNINQQNYISQLDNTAGYKDLQFQTNVLQPHQQDLAYARAMQGAGLQNVNQGLNQGMEGASYGAGAAAGKWGGQIA